MSGARNAPSDRRLLVLAPIGRDAELTTNVLKEAAISSFSCADMRDLAGQLTAGAGAVLVTEEALACEQTARLTAALAEQPTWSDLPIVLLTRPGGDSPVVAQALQSLGNVTLLERPTRVATLLSVVKTALRARHRQYQVRDHLIERERAEQALRASELRLRRLFEANIIGVMSTLEDGRILDANDAFLDMVGYTREELQAGRLNWRTMTPPESLAAELEATRNRTLPNGQVPPYEKEFLRRDGARVPVLLGGTYLEGTSGEGVCFVLDITERKQAEEALRDADRRKDEFLATLAHELRNPLAPIRNSLHILRLTCRDDPAMERVGEVMERQVNHMVRLVDDLLEVSRITRGKIELRREPIELAAVIRSAVETSGPLIDANRHQLAITLPEQPVTINGDMVRLAQVFANLLNNAAKYTDPGGQIWLTAHCEEREVIVSVKDTGTGIAPELLPRIFDLFIQAEHATGRAQGGLGIGLTLVKRLVEMHGGSVEARSSAAGAGSEFIVRLPVLNDCVHERRESKPSVAVLAPKRILVVDDNRDAADSLAHLLKLLGAELQVSYDGQEAIEAIRQFRPQVVLLDLGMPGLDGYDVARWIRQQADLREVTLIALTGWGQEEARQRCREAGFDHHLIKPADVQVLESLLNSLEPGLKGLDPTGAPAGRGG